MKSSSKLELVLDLHLTERTFPSDGELLVGIQQPESYLSNAFSSFGTGQTVMITVSPLKRSYSENFHELTEEQRKCRFDDQPYEGSKFTKYNQDTCNYECMIESLPATTGLHCVPWDIPSLGDTRICSGQEALVFKKEMQLFDASLNCTHCLTNCQGTLFNIKSDSFQTDPIKTCQSRTKFDSIAREEELAIFENKRSVQEGYLQGATLPLKYCRERLANDIVILNINVLTQAIIHSRLEKSATILDKLSMAGMCTKLKDIHVLAF